MHVELDFHWAKHGGPSGLFAWPFFVLILFLYILTLLISLFSVCVYCFINFLNQLVLLLKYYWTSYLNFSATFDRRNLGTVDDASLDFFYKEKHGQTTCHTPLIKNNNNNNWSSYIELDFHWAKHVGPLGFRVCFLCLYFIFIYFNPLKFI